MTTYDILRAGAYITHRPNLAEACGAARDAARVEPNVQFTVEHGGAVKATYKLVKGRLEAVVR